MPSTPPGIGQPTREARTGREDRGQRGNKWWTLVAVCLGTFMLLLDITIVTVALPDIQRALHSSFADLQWVVDAYALTLASFLLTAGSLADIYGRRVLYLIGLVVFTGASALCGFATSTLMLQLSRGLQGVGAAIIFAVSLALLANAFQGKDRGVAFGVWGAVTGLAVALGPLIGGALTSGLSWRWIFFVNVPIGIAAVALTTMRVAESRSPSATRPDWAGFVIFTAALASLVYGLIESNQRSFTDGLVLGCLAAAAVLLAVFLIVERRSAHPMFDLRLLRLPTFSGGSVAAFGLSASIFSMLLYLVLYLQDILGYSPLGAGVRVMYLSGAILVSATVAGALLACAGPAADRARPDHHRCEPAADARPQCGLDLDAPHSGNDRGRRRRRPGKPAAGLHRCRRRAAAAGRHGLRHQLHLPPGRHRHRHRAAGDAVLQRCERRGADPHGRSPRPVHPGTGDRRRGTGRADRQRDRTAARPREAPRGNDHPGRLHHWPEPHPAGRGDHRVRGRRRIAGGYPQPGLRARRARRPGRSPHMRRPVSAGDRLVAAQPGVRTGATHQEGRPQ